MSKKARDRRAYRRSEERYLEGRSKPEDQEIYNMGWNRATVRLLAKWERRQGQLLFQDELEYLNWVFFGLWRPLVKGKK